MNVYDKAHDLGWEVTLVSAKAPYEYWVQPSGWTRSDGPPPDTHFARGRKDLQALLLALEAGESTDPWRDPH
ncbi:MAG: hypothetical protein WD739_08350 [Actinomycetota bacterium]